MYNGEINFDLDVLKEMYKQGKIQNLDEYEMALLKFCHGIDVKKCLKEEFEKHPITLTEDCEIDWSKTKRHDEDNSNNVEQYINQKKKIEKPTEQKFYYLYDDDGNMIAAIPKR